ncbi:hypothetical protein DSECCO2_548390 [anaerobic digester metagenome]
MVVLAPRPEHMERFGVVKPTTGGLVIASIERYEVSFPILEYSSLLVEDAGTVREGHLDLQETPGEHFRQYGEAVLFQLVIGLLHHLGHQPRLPVDEPGVLGRVAVDLHVRSI